ncbi:MDR family NADP-dependent oxidoreductase [Streptomyces antarcticus]|uniref:MDR family NADP-dependent oxidoreductase n=1 Tax=Streptomyces antarcticus TaxID=2996458 RepID=UPI00226FA669|nr:MULTISPECIES: NADP-dependent oxidoreductase [unclassified Streptomyces]MCY0946619.1 NADP-dependent oxidoreductase [Streptomyces sp. H34-AA3]MCZ4085689.1 NADP-dependent oxidoreductase [Streptomyces sp. H34-S5]
MPVPEDFAEAVLTLAEPAEGQAVVENLWLSVDPYMRECMDGDWELDTPLEGRSIGRVVESRSAELPIGSLVFHREGWRTHAVVSAAEVRVLPRYDGVATESFLGLLGGTGLTAYVGLTRIARLRAGETVYVSAAAGGVGTAAGRLARLLGAGRVVGSAGSPAKVRLLTEELGFDAAFDHRTGPSLHEQLGRVAPDGIDIYLDNVGGEHLEAAIGAMREHGRIAWCGAISQYSSGSAPAAPRNLFDLVEKSIRLEGFLVANYRQVQAELEEFLVPHLRAGHISDRLSVTEGFDRTVDAFLGMLRGENTGKSVVRLGRGDLESPCDTP